jgi:hypothetical protein
MMPRGRMPLSRYATHSRYSRSVSWLWEHRGQIGDELILGDLATLMWLPLNSVKKCANVYGITLGSSGCTEDELAQLKLDDGIDFWRLEPALLVGRSKAMRLPAHVRTRLEQILAADRAAPFFVVAVNESSPPPSGERVADSAGVEPAARFPVTYSPITESEEPNGNEG